MRVLYFTVLLVGLNFLALGVENHSVTPTLSKTCHEFQLLRAEDPPLEIARNNLAKLGLLDPRFQYVYFTAEKIESLLRVDFDTLSHEWPALQPLKAILDSPEVITEKEISDQVSLWMKKNGIDFKWTTTKELEDQELARRFFKEGHPKTLKIKGGKLSTSELINENGYIRDDYWLWAYSKGMHPTADVHDFFNHLPMMLIPGVVENYKLQGNLGNRLMLLRNNPTLSKIASKQASVSDDEIQKMAERLTGKIGGPLRNLAYENLPIFISHPDKPLRFVVQGNHANTFSRYLEHYVNYKDMAQHLVGMSNDKAPRMDLIGLFPVELPKRNEFMLLPEAQKLTAELESTLKSLGMQKPDQLKQIAKQIEQKAIEVGNSLNIKSKDPNQKLTPEKILQFQNRLGEKIYNAPEIKPFFDTTNRVALWTNTLRLYDRYVKFLIDQK